MAKHFSIMPKFKRVEAALRDVVVGIRKATDEIDKTLEAKHSVAEKEALGVIKQECNDLIGHARIVIAHVYDAAEGKPFRTDLQKPE